jgi:hypothetical protein
MDNWLTLSVFFRTWRPTVGILMVRMLGARGLCMRMGATPVHS